VVHRAHAVDLFDPAGLKLAIVAFDDFRWQALGELIAGGSVVPIIGDAAIALTQDGQTRPIAALMAERLAADCKLPAPNSRFPLRDVAARAMRSGVTPAVLKQKLRNISASFAQTHPVHDLHPMLGMLTRIADWPLVLTTSTNSYLEESLRAERSQPPLVVDLAQERDLPARWTASSQPTLVHIFGRFSSALKFALTDEDVLEAIRELQHDRRPENLLDVLKDRNLLFIGNCLPDWLARVFMRTLRRDRLSKDHETIKALAEDTIGQETEFVLFLESLGQMTWVYDQDIGSFVERLFTLCRTSSAPPPPDLPASPLPVTENPDVFVSYCSQDEVAAEEVARGLRQAGLETWFAPTSLRAGAQYDAKIRRGIERCTYFVALLSRNTEGDLESYFRQEWACALERLPRQTGTQQRFIVPLLVDDLRLDQLNNVPEVFLKRTLEVAPRGVLPSTLLESLVAELRAKRRAEAQGRL